MRITYVKLVNVAGLKVGSDMNEIEISFEKSKNKIVCIQGKNGAGKSVLLSSLQPYAFVTSLDDRSSISYIIPGKTGYKEIHYKNGFDEYVIKHYYKPNNNGGHSVKSYFVMNGEEMNDNGNVTSFNALVEIHFGITQEMLRLIRLGSNVKSIISLPSAGRKEYISKLIEEMNWYFKVYKEINEEIKVTKVLISSNKNNLYNCHISDIVLEEEKLKKLHSDIKKYDKERDQLILKIGKLNSLISGNNIHALRKQYTETELSLSELKKLEDELKSMSLLNSSMDKLVDKRNDYTERKIQVTSKINSYRISIDNTMQSIERLEVSIKKITSNNDLQSMMSAIKTLRDAINDTSDIIKNFIPCRSTSQEVYNVLTKLQSFNQISQMFNTLGNRSVDVYLTLKDEGKSIDKFVKEQLNVINSRINSNDLMTLINSIFKDEFIIEPNCDSEYKECPYYRISTAIDNAMNDVNNNSFDNETLRSISIVSNNIDSILNELDIIRDKIHIPDAIMEKFTEHSLLSRLRNHLPFFDLTDLQTYLSILREYELYKSNMDKLKQLETNLRIYKNSGIDSHLEEINELKNQITFYRSNISSLENDKIEIDRELISIDKQISMLSKYNENKKHKDVFENTLETLRNIIIPLETAIQDKSELNFQLTHVTNLVNSVREDHKQLENKINEYYRLLEESGKLSKKLSELTMIADSVSTKKGIPVKYMKRYLETIKNIANELLSIIYDESLKLTPFEVTPDTFEIPYVKNGTKIPDVKYASQSEIPSITMALSFALSSRAAGVYNILLLDEVDAGFDDVNRSRFLKMLNNMIHKIHAEQTFIISHNVAQMMNLPMDCIKLSDIGVSSKLQNIIYE